MVAAPPNRTSVVARVLGVEEDASRPEWTVLEVEVRSAAPSEGYRDMLHVQPGARLRVDVHRDWLRAKPPEGATVRFDATVAGPGVVKVAHADPAVTVLDH